MENETTSTTATKDVRRYEATGEPNILRLVGAKDLYFLMKKAGKRWRRDLNTTEMSEAKKRAKALRDSINAGKWEELRGVKERNGWATMPELYTAYEAASTISTKKNVVWAMRYVLKKAGLDPEGSCTQLDAHCVWLFQQAMKKAAGDDAVKLTRAMRSANSLLSQARQLFAEEVLPAYKDLEMPAHVLDRARNPQTRGFMTALKLDAPPVQYVEPPAAVVRQIGANYQTLRKPDAGAYVAFLLGAFVGLRNNEVAAARWDWIEADAEDKNRMWLKIRITADYSTKTLRPRDVEIPAPVFAELVALRGAVTFDKVPGQRTHLVPAPHMTDRTNRVFRRLNKWLRAQGLAEAIFSKGFYELRKYFGNMKAWESGSTYQAARAMGNSPEIVENYYSSSEGKAPLRIAAPKVSAQAIRKAVRTAEKEIAA
jgi:integrase